MICCGPIQSKALLAGVKTTVVFRTLSEQTSFNDSWINMICSSFVVLIRYVLYTCADFCFLADISAKVVEDGYEFFAKRHLVTVFSAPNYCGEFENAGAIMSVDETLMCSFQVYVSIFRASCTVSKSYHLLSDSQTGGQESQGQGEKENSLKNVDW